jgi:hypothetical protein
VGFSTALLAKVPAVLGAPCAPPAGAWAFAGPARQKTTSAQPAALKQELVGIHSSRQRSRNAWIGPDILAQLHTVANSQGVLD